MSINPGIVRMCWIINIIFLEQYSCTLHELIEWKDNEYFRQGLRRLLFLIEIKIKMLFRLSVVRKRRHINDELGVRTEYVPTTWAPHEDQRKWIKPMDATRRHFLGKKVAPSDMKIIPCALKSVFTIIFSCRVKEKFVFF